MSTLKQLLDSQRGYLNYFFDQLDLSVAEAVVNRLIACEGVIVISGVGKSGHIGQKISATLLSTGTKSFFLSPVDALHGDIGFVSKGDVFLAISKSGETQELLDLLPHVKKKGASAIALVSKPESRLARACDLSLELPVERELCPYDLAPTISTEVQLLFGDLLAIALMEAKRFTIRDFARNHPAGLLGRKITLKVSDLMLKENSVPLCREDDKLIDVLHELSGKRCGCLLVADDQLRLKGIFTDGDLRRSIQSRGPDALKTSLAELMTTSYKSIDADLLAFDAMKTMEEDPGRLITVLPVLKNKKIVGLLRMHDILQAGLQARISEENA